MDYAPLLFFAAFPLIIAAQVYLLVRKMSEPEKMLKPIVGNFSPDKEQIIAGHIAWLNARDMRRVTSFEFGAIQTVVFQQHGTQRFFNILFHQKVSYDMESRFDETTFLETSTGGSAGMFPARPKAYKQSFPGMSPEQAWQRHLEAEAYLMRKFGIVWRPLNQPYEQVLINSLRMSMNYVRSIPFYPFRALYWYLVTRQRFSNRSIQQQFP